MSDSYKITVQCPVYGSEDLEKICTTFEGILLNPHVKMKECNAYAIFDDIKCLEKIRTIIESKKNQNSYRKRLLNNAQGNNTWFLLNKQAAFVGKVVLCDEDGDSPLGAIKITLECSDLQRLLELLVPST